MTLLVPSPVAITALHIYSLGFLNILISRSGKQRMERSSKMSMTGMPVLAYFPNTEAAEAED